MPQLAEQDVALPAKPKGQTVVSFKRGMQSLPLAMANQLKDVMRCALASKPQCSNVFCLVLQMWSQWRQLSMVWRWEMA